MLYAIDTPIRLLVIGQQILLVAILLMRSGHRASRWTLAALLVCTIGYVIATSPALTAALGPASWLGVLLAISLPYVLWLFSRAVFEIQWPSRPVLVLSITFVLGFWLAMRFQRYLPPDILPSLNLIARLLSIVVVTHAVYSTWRNRDSDLVESRRRFRKRFVLLVALLVVLVVSTEMSPINQASAWFSLANILAIAALTLGFALPLMSVDYQTLGVARGSSDGTAAQLLPAQRVLMRDLLAAMDDGVYRTPGLSISALSARIGYPQHQIRRVINQALGYRNFSAFLNHYRIEEAKQQLADTELVRTSIVNIAMDLGYSSLPPFNRAFRAATNMTPTAWRKQALGPDSPKKSTIKSEKCASNLKSFEISQ